MRSQQSSQNSHAQVSWKNYELKCLKQKSYYLFDIFNSTSIFSKNQLASLVTLASLEFFILHILNGRMQAAQLVVECMVHLTCVICLALCLARIEMSQIEVTCMIGTHSWGKVASYVIIRHAISFSFMFFQRYR